MSATILNITKYTSLQDLHSLLLFLNVETYGMFGILTLLMFAFIVFMYFNKIKSYATSFYLTLITILPLAIVFTLVGLLEQNVLYLLTMLAGVSVIIIYLKSKEII